MIQPLTLKTFDNSAVVIFKDNRQIQEAFDLLRSAIPKKWADRGRLNYEISPIDESYGDIIWTGLISVRWAPVK